MKTRQKNSRVDNEKEKPEPVKRGRKRSCSSNKQPAVTAAKDVAPKPISQKQKPKRGPQTRQKRSQPPTTKKSTKTPAKKSLKSVGSPRNKQKTPESKKATSKPSSRVRLVRRDLVRIRELQLQRRESLVADINNLSEENAKSLLVDVAMRMPGVIFDILEATPQPGPHQPTGRSLSWCVCSRCQQMETAESTICCGFQPDNCISIRPEMTLLVLDPAVLALANAYRADAWAYQPANDNAERRFDGYRQFTLWRHGRLGRHVRRPIPSCCVLRIHAQYPDPDNLYTGYRPVL